MPHFYLRRAPRRVLLAACAACAALAPAPFARADDLPDEDEEAVFTLPQTTQTPPRNRPSSNAKRPQSPGRLEVTVDRYTRLRWLMGRSFEASGGVRAVFKDMDTGVETVLNGENVVYNAETGQIKADGGVRLDRPEGRFVGLAIEYNTRNGAGSISEALVTTEFFRMRGKRIEAKADGTYVLEDGVFTTCERGQPDYQIRARNITVNPDRFVSARRVTFYAGKTALITLPSFRRSLNTGSAVPFPRIGYNRAEGINLRVADNPIAQPRETLDYDFRVNLRRLPAGILSYQRDATPGGAPALSPFGAVIEASDPLRGVLEQLTPPTYQEYATNRLSAAYQRRTTVFANLINQQFVFNRLRSDLVVSRYPEIGVSFSNVLGHSVSDIDPDALINASRMGSAETALRRVPDVPFLLDITATVSAINEQPTRATAGRFATRTNLMSQPLLLGRRLALRGGASLWLNGYTSGDLYALLSPEVELNYVPTRTSVLGVAYRYAEDLGNTPFAFDRRDVRHELRLRYQVGGPWAFGASTRYDLERVRAYDTELAVVRNFDCLQIGLAYRTRAQQFALIFNLLPPVANRERLRESPLGDPPGVTSATAPKTAASPQ